MTLSTLHTAARLVPKRIGRAGPAEPDEEVRDDKEPRDDYVNRTLDALPVEDEDFDYAERSNDPQVRGNVYSRAKRDLAALDPTNPHAGPEVSATGWIPSNHDLETMRENLRDARYAQSIGMQPEAYRSISERAEHKIQCKMKAGDALEGKTAKDLMADGYPLRDFARPIGPRGTGGEIDTETDHEIVEVTTSRHSKGEQVDLLLHDKQRNPEGKPLIVYGPNMIDAGVRGTEGAGAKVARNYDDLKRLLDELK